MIKNIIFDLGVVLLDVDYEATLRAFGKLGLSEPEKAFSKARQDEFFRAYEKGRISGEDFLEGLSQRMGGVNKEEIRRAWCAMLGDFPLNKFELLELLSQTHALYVLSNTNELHRETFEETIDRNFGWQRFEGIFKFIGYSHRMNCRKPDPEAFEYILKHGSLAPHETLFIDDTYGHVEAARQLGIVGVHYPPNGDLKKLIFEKLN